jgi:selenocysteine lyase/cysteine desulfurase
MPGIVECDSFPHSGRVITASATVSEATDAAAPAACSSLRRLRTEFEGVGAGYLAACTGGLPPASAAEAARSDLELWLTGQASPGHYDASVGRARRAFARLAGVSPDDVAVGSQTSVFAGLIATSLADRAERRGAEVLCVEGDFSSVVFPFLQQAHRGVRVRCVPLAALADSITTSTTMVAYSLVQSATGEIADAAGIRAAADRVGARVFCDVTQAAGWLPLDPDIADALVCHSYKWLCAPRGVCFFALPSSRARSSADARPNDFAAELRPIHAGWYAGDDIWGACYGPDATGADPAPLAATARRFDVSPAWQAAAAAAPALEAFASTDIRAVRDHDVALAEAFAAGLGSTRSAGGAPGSAIVTWDDPDGGDLERLTAAGLVASGRAGRARVAFHVWNDVTDVERACAALRR